MKIAVMGAGAVGCYYGGQLARAGHPVTLIGRAPHVEAMRRDGLDLETQAFRERVPVEASTEAAAVRGAGLVLFCVKATDTEATADQIAPHLDAGATLASLQNGVDNVERIGARLPRRAVIPALVYAAVEMAGPGHVRHHGGGELVVGSGDAERRIAGLFEAAGIAVRISDNMAGALWAKLTLNCAWNALSAIARMPYGPLWQAPGVQDVMRAVVEECLAVARASGVDMPGAPWEAVERIARTMPRQLSSTAQDLARGRPSEIDHLNGYVARRGEALGVPTPANRALHTLVKLIEGSARPSGA